METGSRIFADRSVAGIALGRELQQRYLQPPAIVLGLPRGGVPVAYEVARMLKVPLDVMPVRKVAMPEQPEVAIGAIASGGIVVHEPQFEEEFPDLTGEFERLAKVQRRELERRERLYRRSVGPPELKGKTVILVDDGLATGCTMLAAIRAARAAGADAIVAAAPVASREAAELIRGEADNLVILQTPKRLVATSAWYERFEQLDDRDVCRLLNLNRRPLTGSS
jgi:predicted phosphoribosyltransferase